jgi:hypothetical protein
MRIGKKGARKTVNKLKSPKINKTEELAAARDALQTGNPTANQALGQVSLEPALPGGRNGEGSAKPGAAGSDGRAAVYGLLGAIIGGLATFGGAYWTGHQSENSALVTSQQNACVTFASAADQYLQDLNSLQDSLDQGGAVYAQARARLSAEVPTLYKAAVEVEFINKNPVTADAITITNTLIGFDYDFASPKSIDREKLASIIGASKGQFQKFTGDAQTVFNSDI